MALRISFNDRRIVLPTGQLFIGRSVECHIVVDDPLASRRHAVITMSKSGAFVTDLASKAGVRVNGELISGARRLTKGDAVLVTSLRLVVDDVSVDPDDEPTDPRLRSTIAPPTSNVPGSFRLRPTPPLGIQRVERASSHETVDDGDDEEPASSSSMTRTQEAPRVVLPAFDPQRTATAPRTNAPGVMGPPPASNPGAPGAPEPSQRTPYATPNDAVDPSRIGRLPPLPSFPRGDTLRALASMGEKALALGRAEEAERILLRALQETLDATKRGEADPGTVELAASLAARLASATGSGRWFDHVIALYAARMDVVPSPIVDLLHAAVRKVKSIDKASFRDYLAGLKNAPGDSPARRFLVQRLEGLRLLVDLK